MGSANGSLPSPVERHSSRVAPSGSESGGDELKLYAGNHLLLFQLLDDAPEPFSQFRVAALLS
jgi:hypothetical protein